MGARHRQEKNVLHWAAANRWLYGWPVMLLCQKKKNAIPSTAYARSRKTPSSQFDSASLMTDDATATDSAMLATSMVLKARSIGWLNAIPKRTNTGAISSATCTLEPMAMLSERSIRLR